MKKYLIEPVFFQNDLPNRKDEREIDPGNREMQLEVVRKTRTEREIRMLMRRIEDFKHAYHRIYGRNDPVGRKNGGGLQKMFWSVTEPDIRSTDTINPFKEKEQKFISESVRKKNGLPISVL